MRDIYFIGDTHGMFASLRHKTSKIRPSKGSLFIHLGDWTFDCALDDERAWDQIQAAHDLMDEYDSEMWALRGNHCNPEFFYSEEVSMKLSKLGGRIRLLKDYTKETIDGVNFLFVGGGVSVNRTFLSANLEDYEWFVDEGIPRLDYSDKLPVDILVTHGGAGRLMNQLDGGSPNIQKYLDNDIDLKADLDDENAYAENLFARSEASLWVQGHYHCSKHPGFCLPRALYFAGWCKYHQRLQEAHFEHYNRF